MFAKRRCIKRICLATLTLGLSCLFIVFIIVPFIFRYSYSLQRNLLFLSFVKYPHNIDYNKPSNLGLIGGRNFYITTEDNARIGVWHLLPVNRQLEALATNFLYTDASQNITYDDWLKHGPVIIYLHGNAGTRATEYRVKLYKIFTANNFHVITFDYRSYADSSSHIADEAGVVKDSKAVFNWVYRRANKDKIFVWGHSLGSGIAAHMLAELAAEGKTCAGVILEAPFNNLSDEIREYPMSQLFRPLPWFDFCFIYPVYENNLRFESDKNLRNVTAPILILHAEDDHIVPYKLGQKLYDSITEGRNEEYPVKFVTFERKLALGHHFIFTSKNLTSIMMSFVHESLQKKIS